jgi:hypothetical protein
VTAFGATDDEDEDDEYSAGESPISLIPSPSDGSD